MVNHLNKHEESQKKRLKSLEDFQRIQTKKRKLIARSLRTISASTTNRIVFSDIEEEEKPKTSFEAHKTKKFNDVRFKIDEKFLSDNSDSENEKLQTKEVLRDNEKEKVVLNSKIDKTFYETDFEFIKELKDKKGTSQNEDFSFLSLMGRDTIEKSKPTVSWNIDKNKCEKKKEQSLIPKSHENPWKFLLDTLQSDVISDENKTHLIFNVDFNEIRSITSSFRRHNLDHLQKSWKKHRKGFIKTYKKQRKLALNEMKKTNFCKDKKQ